MESSISPGKPYNITPSDSADLPLRIRDLIIAVGGTVKFTGPDGVTDTITLPAGSFPLLINRLWATGTTATGLTGIVI